MNFTSRMIAFALLATYVSQAFPAQSNLALDRAARAGDVKSVASLLAQGADPNEINQWGTNALTGACTLGSSSPGHTEIVWLLLSHGAEINRRLAFGTTALNEAAFWGHRETTLLLLKAGADVNGAKDNGYTPLLGAANNGHIEIVRALIASGADKAARNARGLDAVQLAASAGHQEVVELLTRASEEEPPTLEGTAGSSNASGATRSSAQASASVAALMAMLTFGIAIAFGSYAREGLQQVTRFWRWMGMVTFVICIFLGFALLLAGGVDPRLSGYALWGAFGGYAWRAIQLARERRRSARSEREPTAVASRDLPNGQFSRPVNNDEADCEPAGAGRWVAVPQPEPEPAPRADQSGAVTVPPNRASGLARMNPELRSRLIRGGLAIICAAWLAYAFSEIYTDNHVYGAGTRSDTGEFVLFGLLPVVIVLILAWIAAAWRKG